MNPVRFIQNHAVTIIRMMADIVMVNAALLLSLWLRFMLLDVGDQEGISLPKVLAAYQHAYLLNAPIFTAATVLIFHFNGIYSRAPGYVGKFKLLVVFRAVTVVFLLCGAVHYLAWQAQSPRAFPRGVLVMAWFWTLLFTGGVRLTKDILVASPRPRAKRAIRPDQWTERVLVIGGCGYIGAVLCRKLLEEGYKVRVLDNLMFGVEPIKAIAGHENFELERGDFRDVESVVHTMKDSDKVVHLGAIVGDPACEIDSEFTIAVNFAATRMIAEVAKGYGVERLVFASTCSVYGAADVLLDEHSALNPISLYAETKIDAEATLLKAADTDFSPVILRFATLFGFAPRPRFDLVVNLFAGQAHNEKKITIINGEQWRPFVHVNDVAEAICATLRAPLSVVKGQTYNVGGNNMNYRISELGRIVAKTIPGTEVIEKTAPGDLRNYRVSFDKIAHEVGFRPVVSLEEGILEIAEAFKREEVDDYKADKYSNLSYTRHILDEEKKRDEHSLSESP